MKKIALIVDVKNWAFDNAANIIKNSINEYFDVDIFYSKSEEFDDDLVKILNKVKDYDIIHFFWRKTLLQICDGNVQKNLIDSGINIEEISQKISTGIYDHLFIDSDEYDDVFNKYCKKYVTSSKKLYDIYCEKNGIKNPDSILGDTFDEKFFCPENVNRFEENSNAELIIGWVGNSNWNNKMLDLNGNCIDFKGYNTILKPVVDELISEGYSIKLYCADKNTNFIPIDKMNEYYNKIDVYVCVSITEGTPKPLIEAMGCAVPIITTDVGVAREYFGDFQKEFIISERKIGDNSEKIKEELKEKIKIFYNDRSYLKKLSKENFENSKLCNSTSYKEKYLKYFLNF